MSWIFYGIEISIVYTITLNFKYMLCGNITLTFKKVDMQGGICIEQFKNEELLLE